MPLPQALNEWMDDLSEDWVEQPRSWSPSSPSSSSHFRSTSKRKSILSERSQNESNIQANTAQRKQRLGLSRRSLSDASSTGSQARFDTTTRKSVSVSPPKARQQQQEDVPEWRRRLLQGQLGECKDLFSPMAIENIFQKPPPPRMGSLRQARQQQEGKPKGLSFLKGLEQMSSSPPIWQPSLPERYGTVKSQQPQLSALDEEDEAGEESAQEPMNEELSDEFDEGSRLSSVAPSDQHHQQPSSRPASNGSVARNEALASRKTSFNSVRLQPQSRNISGTGNWSQTSDDFSPVFISKHNTADGRIAYAALDITKSELEAQLQRLHTSQRTHSRTVSQSTRGNVTGGDESSLARLESEALPEDLPVGTPDVADVASIGEFVSIKRGGYSDIGSFKRRPLSPSPLARPLSVTDANESSMMPSQLEYSELPPAVPTPPDANLGLPKTPHTERKQDFLSPQRAKSSNSPLKLFENHDTFTANRLQRRISQLEEPDLSGIVETRGSPSRRVTGEDLSAVEEASFVGQDETQRRQSSIQHHFGHGGFDNHTFDESGFSSPDNSRVERDMPSRSPSPDAMPPGYQQPFRFHVDEPPQDYADTFKGKRKPSKTSTNGGLSIAKRNDRNRPLLSVMTADQRVTSQPSQLSQVSEGKRPLTPSPFKSPTPKRRRTVMHNEMNADEADEARMTLPHDSHASFQNALSRKRRDARHGSERTLADPDILAQRSILRPRNPTPSQRRRMEAEEQQAKVAAIQEQLGVSPQPGESADSAQVRALATHLAVMTEDVAQRKKSVTTQDFLDDAMKVMHFIRTQYRPGNSQLASVNEGDDGGQSELPQGEESELEFEDATALRRVSLERPPSREGGPRSAWRTGRQGRYDERVVSHLRKFQEGDEEEAFLTASSRATYPYEHRDEVTSAHIETVESDPPGITIIGQSRAVQERSRSRSESEPSNKAHNSSGSKQTHSSRTSFDSTLGRATTTSRKSENVATLAPDAVAHLIPEQVAGMTYDKELGRWVKAKKKSSRETGERNGIAAEHSGMTGVTGSDNDPFGDIPDLTVDSVEETKHLLMSRSAGRKGIGIPPEGASALMDFSSRPPTRDNEEDVPEASEVHLSPQRDLGPPPKVSITPATERKRTLPVAEPESPEQDEPKMMEDEVEHEISIFEGRAKQSPVREVRNITVSMSSPAWARGLSPVLESPGVSTRDYGRKPPQATPAFQKQDTRQLSLSVRVSGTVTTKQKENHDLAPLSSSPCKGDVTFYLSELPEFTLNQIDERELQARALSTRNTVGPLFHGTEDRYAAGNHLLLKALQDVEPDEPYWEDLRRLDVPAKDLTSLHLLDVLCDRLETLDASRNELAQLNGAPSTLRCLSVRANCLNGLTAWGHLGNLQYLDIRENEIESLEGLAALVHLREVRADGNKIANLRGLEGLDGLLRVTLRDNRLAGVDFEGCDLSRLESLDIGGNALSSVKGLHCLPRLKHLKLDSAHLKAFPQESQPCVQLQTLDLSGNDLTQLDLVAFCPKIRDLNVDGNKLSSTAGISQLRRLEKLSMRAQSPTDGECDFTPILEARLPDLHTLCLSENRISSLTLPKDWYSLHTLELASCGLQCLPDSFGLSVPNLRALNLNFNAIKDLRSLLNIKALSELHVAGNRLARLRKTTAVLAKLKKMERLDLRDNPFCLGFHPKAVESRIVSTAAVLPDDGDHAGRADEERDEPMQFILPPCDRDIDAQYFARLDDGTKLRRRVYEMLLANNCEVLGGLDGLPFRREDTLVRDEIWERLVMLGVLKKSGKVVEEHEDEGTSP